MSGQMQSQSVDVVVIGAGPAGAHAAGSMAQAGLDVALVDRKAKGKAGAQWLNGVAPWMLDEAGVPRPASTNNRDIGPIFSMAAPGADRRVRIVDNPVLDMNMIELGTELADVFESCSSAYSFWEHDLVDAQMVDGRMASVVLRNRNDHTLTQLKAQLFVDCSGMSAVLRKANPWLEQKCSPPRPEHICVAAQACYKIRDLEGARGFLGEHRIESGEVIGWVGVEGGFSILRPELDLVHQNFSILTGSIAKRGFRSGKQILDDFVADLTWLGECEIYGHRAIPLRRPYAHQVAPGLALLGDAGSHIFSSHGSGIGISLIAARILSDAVGTAYASGADIGTLESLWAYPKKFHREYGGVLGFADAMRRFSQSLTSDETRMMFEEGILTVGMARGGLGQFTPELELSDAKEQLRGLMKTRPLAAKLIKVLGRMPAIYALAARFPGRPAQSRITVSAWDYAMSRLVDSVSVE